MSRAVINRIIPFSCVDGPGNRMAIFLQGCNFKCLYCHNPETIGICNHCGKCVKHCPENALYIENNKVFWKEQKCSECDRCLQNCYRSSSPKTKEMTAGDVLKEIKKVAPFISGITISGGECTLQASFIAQLFQQVKALGLTTLLDTNASMPLWGQEDLIAHMDGAMVDVKSYDEKEHLMLTGMSNEIVLKNIDFLFSIVKLYEIRTVIVPRILNNEYNVEKISQWIAKRDPKILYKIISYRPIGVRTDKLTAEIPKKEHMEKLYKIAINNGCKNVQII